MQVVRTQPVVEVLPEGTRRLTCRQVLVCCHHHARPHASRPVAPDWVVFPLLQKPEELHLGAEAQVTDLVEEQGPVRGLLDHAASRLGSTGVSPLHVPEEGVRYHGVVESRHVHRDELTLAP